METKYECQQCGGIAVIQRIDNVGHSQAFCQVCGYETEWTDFTWPDLLAACKCAEADLYSMVSDYMDIDIETSEEPQAKTIRELQQAIAKAEGK